MTLYCEAVSFLGENGLVVILFNPNDFLSEGMPVGIQSKEIYTWRQEPGV